MKGYITKRGLWLVVLFVLTAVLSSPSFAAAPGEQTAAMPGGSEYMTKMSAELQRMLPQNFNLPLHGLQNWGALCANCGKPFKEGARFCTECGKPVAGICPKCDATVDIEAKFCSNCGVSLQKTCSSCGAPLPADAAFCASCGKKVE